MCSVGDLDSSVTRSRFRVSLAAFFLAVVVSLASIGTVQAESGALGHLGARVLSFATQVVPVGERRTVPPVSEVSVRLDGLREGLKPIAQACYWR